MILQTLLCWLYEVIVVQEREDVVVTYCAPTQELVRKVRARFQALLPAQSGLEHVWSLGFDRKRSEDMLWSQLKELLQRLDMTAVQVADTLSFMIDSIWNMWVESSGTPSCGSSNPANQLSGLSEEQNFRSCQRECLLLLALQHY